MKRKGQSVNIDWTVGLSLFLVTSLAGVLFIMNVNIGPEPVNSLKAKTFDVQQNLEDETFIEGSKVPIIIRGPRNISDVPIDSNYSFPSGAHPGSGGMGTPADIDIANDHIITVIDVGNKTYSFSYFHENVSNISYSNDISTGSWINNTNISVKPESPGLTSLQINNQELLNSTADLGSGSLSITEKELHAETLSDNLRVYNGSTEMILDNRDGNVTFKLKNMTDLYWYRDDSVTSLTGTGTKKQGDTKGFTVASSHGITFIGNLTATVSKPDTQTVKAEINAEKIRLRLHDSGYQTGKDRIKFYDEGYIVFGARKKISAAYSSKINDLGSKDNKSFESALSMEDFGYNISFGKEGTSDFIDRGISIPLDVSTVVSERPSILVDRNGSYSEIKNRVVLWR